MHAEGFVFWGRETLIMEGRTMKNWKVSVKLIVSFLIVAALTAIVGIVGIVGMRNIDSSFDDMYQMQTVPLPELGKAIEMLQRQRACMREFIIGSAVDDFDLIEDAYRRVQEYRPIMYASLDAYSATIRDPEAVRLFNEARNLYDTDFRECIELIYSLAKSDTEPAELYEIMRRYTAATNKIVENFDICMSMKITVAADAASSSSSMADNMLYLIIGVLALALIAAIVLALYISGLISKPLSTLSVFMNKAGSTGDISLSPEDVKIISSMSMVKDEIGQTISQTASFIEHVTRIAGELKTISSGDLTADIKLLSNNDTMGLSLKNMVDNLNDMFGNIQASTGQVSVGSKQVADGAQALAQGATEQAASIEELSSSIAEIANKTKENAQIADQTSKLSETIRESALKGSSQMDEMITAVKEINDASQSISKIIKTIDDIAFQTNILALNAAVEAARAGQHGKGFAVVAEEVRNLASKSAEAAKDTGDMIQNSMEKAELGSRIAGETATSLKDIVTGINESGQMISDIARASEEQSHGISQINIGIDQVAQVVQQNSATAEESAAASEEMSSQSAILEELISQFRLKSGSSTFKGLPAPAPAARAPQRSYDSPPAPSISKGGDFGKY